MMGALVLTAKMDEALALRLDVLRQRYFPAARNFLAAHLTLFHALPEARQTEIESTLLEATSRTSAMALSVIGPKPLGYGVALQVEAEALIHWRAALAGHWSNSLTAQDQQKLRPHVTVQNKVTPQQAKATLAEIRSSWPGRLDGRIDGVELWRYEGGPWRHLRCFKFLR